ncbi:MAG: hypothetical protein WEE66_15030 [Actinomycetota bacterium]
MDRVPVFTSSEPVEGWRIWNLSEGPTGPSLLPAGSGVDAWSPRRAVEARCGAPSLLSVGRRSHRVPALDCRCGIYAGRSLETFGRPRPAWPPPSVVGTVALWGKVIEHERGWRGQLAYPSRLALVCVMCAWFEPGPGKPAVVHTFAQRLYALCEEHRGGVMVPDGRRTRAIDVAPRALQARLLDAYAVDLLPFASFEWLFRQPPTPEPPAYVPSIRRVPA